MSNDTLFPIVGIGASAGGVEALEGFFRGLPAHPGIALVIVTHLSPSRESRLPEVLERFTTMPVHTARHGMQVQVDTVYVIPADAVLGIQNGQLQLQRSVGRRERKPIDIFFSALALDRGDLAAGVVLSGGDGDGTLGIKAIKERGGLTLAQAADGFGPGHPDMPNSAIATGLIDFAIPVDQMGAKLVEFAHGSQWLDGLEVGPNDTLAEREQEVVSELLCKQLAWPGGVSLAQLAEPTKRSPNKIMNCILASGQATAGFQRMAA